MRRLGRKQRALMKVWIGCLILTFSVMAWGYEEIEVLDGGTIAGNVKFAGAPPAAEKIVVTKDQEACGKSEKVNEALLVGSNKGIQNVVVFIANVQKGKKMPAGGARLDQKDCRYDPHVVLSPAGAELTILNSDGILHNIHSYSTKNPPFNKAQPKFKKELKEKFAEPETIKLTCDAHGWMTGWLVIQDHPYYTTTDSNGDFVIDNVPAGDYELKFWHETLGERVQRVTVKSKATTQVSTVLSK